MANAQNESDLLLMFDCLMQDYIHNEMQLDIEQFRALTFKHFLLRQQCESGSEDSDGEDSALEESETPEVQVFEIVCNKIYILI